MSRGAQRGARVGILAQRADIPGRLLDKINTISPGRAVLLNPEMDRGDFSLDADRLELAGIDLAALEAVWVHGFSYENPVIPRPETRQEWSVWQVDYLSQQQRYSALFSLLEELARRGVKLFNAPQAYIQSYRMFSFLEELRSLGFLVPKLVCTNDPDAAGEFMHEHDPVIWRLATGRSAWQLFREKQVRAFVHPSKPPVILGEAVSGPLQRAYLLNGKVVSCIESRSPRFTPPLETLEVLWEVSCAQSAQDLESLAQRTGLEWAVVSFVPGQDGPLIFDCDPDPVLDWLPPVQQGYILDILAGFLSGKPTVAVEPPQFDQERPSLFLRRMMGILFQFEASKQS